MDRDTPSRADRDGHRDSHRDAGACFDGDANSDCNAHTHTGRHGHVHAQAGQAEATYTDARVGPHAPVRAHAPAGYTSGG